MYFIYSTDNPEILIYLGFINNDGYQNLKTVIVENQTPDYPL